MMVVFATPFEFVMVGLLRIRSCLDGVDVKDQKTGCPEIGLPFASTTVALTTMGTPHLTWPTGREIVTAPATSPA
jgi:hypothetical protein